MMTNRTSSFAGKQHIGSIQKTTINVRAIPRKVSAQGTQLVQGCSIKAIYSIGHESTSPSVTTPIAIPKEQLWLLLSTACGVHLAGHWGKAQPKTSKHLAEYQILPSPKYAHIPTSSFLCPPFPPLKLQIPGRELKNMSMESEMLV